MFSWFHPSLDLWMWTELISISFWKTNWIPPKKIFTALRLLLHDSLGVPNHFIYIYIFFFQCAVRVCGYLQCCKVKSESLEKKTHLKIFASHAVQKKIYLSPAFLNWICFIYLSVPRSVHFNGRRSLIQSQLRWWSWRRFLMPHTEQLTVSTFLLKSEFTIFEGLAG